MGQTIKIYIVVYLEIQELKTKVKQPCSIQIKHEYFLSSLLSDNGEHSLSAGPAADCLSQGQGKDLFHST